MLTHYLSIAARRLRRSPTSAVVNVLTLALGLTCFVAASAVVGFWDRAERHFANADRTHVVTSVSWAGLVVPGTNAFVAELLEADFPAIEATARVTAIGRDALRVSAEVRSARVRTYAVDAEFLAIFDLPAVSGHLRDALLRPRSVVLTAAAANSLYGSENAVGKPVLVEGVHEATVTGVIAEIPEPSHMGRSASATLSFDMLASRDLHDTMADAGPGLVPRGGSPWATQDHITYVLLPADGALSAAQLREQLGPFVRRHAPTELLAENAPELELGLMPIRSLLAASASDAVFLREAGVSAPAVLLGLGTLVLLIACANYANLAIARAALRGREVGVRKTLGAKRRQLVLQYAVDAALHACAALLIAIAAVRMIGPMLDSTLGIDVNLSLLADLPSYTFLVGTVVAVTALAGAYPAAVLSGIQPIDAIRSSVSPLGPRVLTHVLTGAQFAAASFLLAAVGVIFLQHRALERAVLADGGDPLLIIENDPAETQVAADTLHDELLALPQVLAATRAAGVPWSGGAGAPPPVGRTPDGSTPPRPVRMYGVGEAFFSTLGIAVLAGRTFESGAGDAPTPGIGGPDPPLPIVVDRDLTERLGFSSPEQAAGEIVYWLWAELTPGGPANPLEIVGVVENRRLNIATGLGPASSIYAFSPTSLPVHLVRISGTDVAGALEDIDALWRRLGPTVALERRFASDLFDERFESYARIGQALAVLSIFALVISTLGLLGMALLLAGRRVHEIGVRKTLGARKEQIVRMLMLSLARPVVIANIIALPFAFLFGRAYLGTFDQPIEMTPWPFVFSIAFTLTVAWAAVGQEAWRAASVRPSDVLRRE